MKIWLHKIEVIVDRSIPYIIIVLLFLIIGELFFYEQVQPYIKWINLTDNFVVGVFVIDLIFKYIRIRNIPKFFRKCWMDIIAVFPFFLLFRLFEELGILLGLGERIGSAQLIFHEGVEIEKEAEGIIKEGEKISKVSRTRMAVRFIRPIARSPRLLKTLAYYEKPTGKHHIHERKKK